MFCFQSHIAKSVDECMTAVSSKPKLVVVVTCTLIIQYELRRKQPTKIDTCFRDFTITTNFLPNYGWYRTAMSFFSLSVFFFFLNISTVINGVIGIDSCISIRKCFNDHSKPGLPVKRPNKQAKTSYEKRLKFPGFSCYNCTSFKRQGFFFVALWWRNNDIKNFIVIINGHCIQLEIQLNFT